MRIDRPERLTVILLQYKRPFNLNRLLSSVLLCDFVDEVLVSLNDPSIDVGRYLKLNDPRIRVVRQARRRFPSVRCELALLALNEWILAIDDDLFPTPQQIAQLFTALLDDPAVPHGFGGNTFDLDSAGRPRHRIISRREGVTDALVWLFAFTKSHVRRYFELLEAVGIHNDELSSSEDVPLSFSGSSLARIHATGPLLRCPTSSSEGIATWREGGFLEHRVGLVTRMRQVTGYPHATDTR